MAEPLSTPHNQTRLDPAHAVDEDQPRWRWHLAWGHGTPFSGRKLDVENGSFFRTGLDVVKRQLGPIIDLPWIESHLQFAERAHRVYREENVYQNILTHV